MSDLSIRQAGLHDIPDIQRLYRQLDRHHAELLPEVFEPLQADARGDEVIQKWIERGDAVYLLAELNGTVVGFLNVQRSAHPRLPMFRPHAFAMVENVVVDQPHRGKGVGKELFAAAIAWARGNGLRYVQTSVWDRNARARKFYRDQGFQSMTSRLELDTERHAEPSPGDG